MSPQIDQRRLLEAYKAVTQAEIEARIDRQKRIYDVKALAVLLFAVWVFLGLCMLLATRC